MDINLIWNEYGVPILTVIASMGLSGTVLYTLVSGLIDKFTKRNNSQDIANDVKKYISDKAVQIAVLPIVKDAMEELKSLSAKELSSLLQIIIELKGDMATLREAVSYSKMIPKEVKQKLIQGECVEVEQPEEIKIADLIIEKEEPQPQPEKESVDISAYQ